MKQPGHIRKRKTPKTAYRRGQDFRKNPPVFSSHNFSDIEDNIKAFEIISEIAVHAGNNAGLEAKAAGLSRAYIRSNQQLVKVSPEGEETILVSKSRRSSYYRQFKPHTVFHAVKK